jgi:hypothetical protein
MAIDLVSYCASFLNPNIWLSIEIKVAELFSDSYQYVLCRFRFSLLFKISNTREAIDPQNFLSFFFVA